MSFISPFRKGVLPFAAVSVFAFSPSTPVLSAEDGTPGQAPDGSTGSLDIQMTVPKIIRITGLTDIEITEGDVVDAINNEADVAKSVNACVGGNGGFTYEITSDSTSGYELIPQDIGTTSDDTATPVPFTVAWKAGALNDGDSQNTLDLDRENLGTAVCENTGNLVVTVDDVELFNAKYGFYQGALALTVVPE